MMNTGEVDNRAADKSNENTFSTAANPNNSRLMHRITSATYRLKGRRIEKTPAQAKRRSERARRLIRVAVSRRMEFGALLTINLI